VLWDAGLFNWAQCDGQPWWCGLHWEFASDALSSIPLYGGAQNAHLVPGLCLLFGFYKYGF
jgi:hypothetical protein